MNVKINIIRHNRFLQLLTFALFLYATQAFPYSGPFYVDDTSGNDSNDGSFLSPFLTIQKAVDRIAPGVDVTSATCYVYPGTYQEDVSITYNNNPGWLVISALTNTKRPVIDGLKSLSTGIDIQNMRMVLLKQLEIRNFSDNGIRFNNAIQNRIENCYFRSNHTGVLFEYGGTSYSNSIENSTFLSNFYAILVGDWNNSKCVFDNNTFVLQPSSASRGIVAFAANDFIIRNNIFIGYEKSQYGGVQFFRHWTSLIITNNIFQHFQCALAFFDWSYNQVTANNLFTNCNTGIHISGSTAGTYRKNTFKNTDWNSFFIQGTSYWNLFIENDISLNSQGIEVSVASASNTFKNNKIHNYIGKGFLIKGPNNQLINNQMLTNAGQTPAIECVSNAYKTSIISNLITSLQGPGIRMNNINAYTLKQNAVFKCQSGMEFNNATNGFVYNNSLVSNVESGINVGSYCSLRGINNLSAYNGAYGVYISNATSVMTNSYTLFYGNGISAHGSFGFFLNSNITNFDPDLATYNPLSIDFLKPNPSSPCVNSGVDVGIPYAESAPDIGWVESVFIPAELAVNKSIQQILLAGNPSKPIPGALVEYIISVSNKNGTGRNIVIYDRLPSKTVFLTNSVLAGTGFITEFSTNQNPSLTYNSMDFSDIEPSPSQVKWIRWKCSELNYLEKREMKYKVIIK